MRPAITRSTIEHLRFPFSFFLAPVCVFALSETGVEPLGRAALVFAILHLAVYPASNGYNSYYDRDEGPIGGVERPQTVTPDLLYASLGLEAIGLLAAALLGPLCFALLFVYGLVSKGYSHPRVRLKARPWLGFGSVALFQGAVVYLAVIAAMLDPSPSTLLDARHLIPACLSVLLMGAGYPMTQIYQHAEDRARGDRTLSRILGLRGTFAFSSALFAVAIAGFFAWLWPARPTAFLALSIGLIPTGLFVTRWALAVIAEPDNADFRRTMQLNRLSSASLIVVFTSFFWL